ncbi:MAG: hypothetical protein ABSB13_09920 [Candidatus Binatus sp.]
MRIAIGGHQCGAELECVGGSQWMVHNDALSVKAGSDGIVDFNPSKRDFVHVAYCAVPQSHHIRPLTLLSRDRCEYFDSRHHPGCDAGISGSPPFNFRSCCLFDE